MLQAGQRVHADCLVVSANDDQIIAIEQCAAHEADDDLEGMRGLSKQDFGANGTVELSYGTVFFTDSVIQTCGGGLYGVVIAVGDSRASYANKEEDVVVEDDEKEDEVINAQYSILKALLIFIFVAGVLTLVLFYTLGSLTWKVSADLSFMLIVYGFPYTLMIPSIWDMVVSGTVNRLMADMVYTKNAVSIKHVGSLDFLVVS